MVSRQVVVIRGWQEGGESGSEPRATGPRATHHNRSSDEGHAPYVSVIRGQPRTSPSLTSAPQLRLPQTHTLPVFLTGTQAPSSAARAPTGLRGPAPAPPAPTLTATRRPRGLHATSAEPFPRRPTRTSSSHWGHSRAAPNRRHTKRARGPSHHAHRGTRSAGS